jgi:hypothetical protein
VVINCFILANVYYLLYWLVILSPNYSISDLNFDILSRSAPKSLHFLVNLCVLFLLVLPNCTELKARIQSDPSFLYSQTTASPPAFLNSFLNTSNRNSRSSPTLPLSSPCPTLPLSCPTLPLSSPCPSPSS